MNISAGTPIQHLRATLSANPNQPQLWAQLGAIHFARNEFKPAADCFRNALFFDANNASRFHDLGVALKREGRFSEAEAMLRESVRRNPDRPASALSLASMLVHHGRIDEADALLRDAAERMPGDFDVLRDLANHLVETGRAAEAADHALRFIKRNGKTTAALAQLSVCFEAQSLLDQALDVTALSVTQEPPTQLDIRLASYASIAGQLARFDHRARAAAMLRDAIPASLPEGKRADWRRNDTNALRRFAYSLPYYQTPDPLLMRVFTAIGDALAARADRLPPPSPPDTQRLRVGYVSHNFTNHPIGHLLSHVFEAHGAAGADLFVYSSHRNRSDANDYAGRIERAVGAGYRDCRGWTDDRMIAQIRRDGLHILIDLDGYLAGGRPEIFARRPAPVQIHWLQHLAGMPAPFIDWTIVDRVLVRDEERNSGAVPLIRLVDAFQCGDQVSLPAKPPRRADHGLPESAFVFCAFGAWLKIDEEVFDAWLEILRAVPDGVLWLAEGGTSASRDALRRRAQDAGVAPERLVFAPRLDDKSAHLDRHRCADLFLDTFAFSAATTAMDALWAGLPVLTRPGPTAQSRLAESHLRAVGIADLIVRDTQAYVATAIRLSRERAELDKLKKRLKLLAPKSRLFNAERMAKQLGQVYAEAWRRHVSGAPKEHFDVRM